MDRGASGKRGAGRATECMRHDKVKVHGFARGACDCRAALRHMEECFVHMNRLLLIGAATVALAYVAMCVLLFIWQRRLLYLRASTPPDEQLDYARGAAGLTPLIVEMRPARASVGNAKRVAGEAQRWVVFHGNAGLAVQQPAGRMH